MQALQNVFAEVCNALAPVVQQTRCWNRVALHHLAYHDLRGSFPQMGSQMVCNAIYSVSRAYRLVLQHPGSPWNVAKHPEMAIPRVSFLPDSPVFFDRHTLSLKDGRLSLYTLDGRMRFQLELKAEDLVRFRQDKLREIVLAKTPQGYQLSFWFSPAGEQEDAGASAPASSAEFPDHLVVVPGVEAGAERSQELAA
ncbi:MAG: hypothetical protein Q8O38_06735 [Sulfurimicrobium sp.]|nr:hypothetical protein [Sulfurimicrobium sp.]